jgi:hypothetical protein
LKQAIFLTAILIVTAYIQLSGQEGKPMVISGVTEVADVALEDLYNRAYLWASGGSIDGLYSIHELDRWNGILIMTGSFPFQMKKNVIGWRRIEGHIFYRLTIYTRDGKYKYVFSHFVHQGSGDQAIDYGRIYDSKSTDLHLAPEPHLVVINELLTLVREQVNIKVQILQEVMKKPTELETVW